MMGSDDDDDVMMMINKKTTNNLHCPQNQNQIIQLNNIWEA